ncbi:MAG: hypothetical protein P9L88_07490 [Candidatus Tantalella remota]|nr:hypothetical protein [Candidatus Tantalella remota]
MRKLAILILIIFSFATLTHAAQAPSRAWQPAGESVAGPEDTSDTVQTAERASADEQIRYGRNKEPQKTGNQGYIYYTDAYDEYYRGPSYPYDREGPITPRNLHSYVSYGSDSRVGRRDVYIHTD